MQFRESTFSVRPASILFTILSDSVSVTCIFTFLTNIFVLPGRLACLQFSVSFNLLDVSARGGEWWAQKARFMCTEEHKNKDVFITLKCLRTQNSRLCEHYNRSWSKMNRIYYKLFVESSYVKKELLPFLSVMYF